MKYLPKLILVFLLLMGTVAPCCAEGPPFRLLYRQDKVEVGETSTSSNLMINVINNSGSDAKDLTVYLPVPNPFLHVDTPVFIGSVPNGRQGEVLCRTRLNNDLIAASEPEERIVWRIEYLNANGELTSVLINGERGI